MKNSMKGLISLVLISIGATLFSNEVYAQKKEVYDVLSNIETVKPFGHIAVGVEVGTLGAGIQISAPLTKFMGVRAGYVFMPKIKKTFTADYDIPNTEEINSIINNPLYSDIKTELSAQGLPTNVSQLPTSADIDAKLNLGNAKLLVDFYPAKRSCFHLTVGMFAGSTKLADATGGIDKQIIDVYNVLSSYATQYGYTFEDQIVLGDETFTAKDLEYMNLRAEVNTVKPYFGFGFGRPVPRGRVGVQCDFGVAYMGKAKLVGNTTKLTTAINNELVNKGDEKYLNYSKFYPVASIQINVRLF